MVYEEKLYILGSTGNTGQPLVNKLLKNPKVSLTLYTRSPAKVQQLFGEQPDGKLQIVQGDFNDKGAFRKSIQGHKRLFLLIQVLDFKNYLIIVREFAQIAYDAGVAQIVLISGTSGSMPYRTTAFNPIILEGVLSIKDRGDLIALCPGNFMSNQFNPGADVDTVKNISKIFDVREPDQKNPWISPNDIGEIAANILQDPIEKHEDAVYELVGDPNTPKEYVEILIRYYDILTKQAGLPHKMAFTLLYYAKCLVIDNASPGLSVLLGRQPETLEQWVEKHKYAFM
ncbi:hypothetical protein BDA99DRAFT_539298 [Phascolomyces articulosus]|uniref:NAD(P)-binding domain-containing protein n=1 Tax=Phascolomyces articulosus TaxID=60185 RepID=A0AAD5K635_9FUNG|nr:hypothetical protein BDA99DRAFT_539298 [Phascolomyces articulosus]